MTDLSETVSTVMYGKSSQANTPGNDNDDFRAGYDTGSTCTDGIQSKVWQDRYSHYRKPLPGGPRWMNWTEWKRGFWAAKFQAIGAEIVEQ